MQLSPCWWEYSQENEELKEELQKLAAKVKILEAQRKLKAWIEHEEIDNKLFILRKGNHTKKKGKLVSKAL